MLVLVPLSQIDDNPFQTRQVYDEIEELAADIAAARATHPETLGLLQVPRGRLANAAGLVKHREVVEQYTPNPDMAYAANAADLESSGIRIQLAFGHRRLRAFRHLHESGNESAAAAGMMPVYLDDMSDDQMLDAVWSENYQRRDISAVEQAELLAAKLARPLSDGQSRSQRHVAEEWNLARPTVANRLRLLDLPAEVQAANRDGRLSERQCLALATVALLAALEKEQGKPLAKWSNATKPEMWGNPISPGNFIQWVLANPATTSDRIRDYVRDAVGYAGDVLPKAVADRPFANGQNELGMTKIDIPLKLFSQMYQVKCSGCKFRVNDFCLRQSCLAAKKEAYVELTLRETAEALGYPVSDRAEDFKLFATDADARATLRRAYDAGVDANYVIAWRAEERGVRPFVAEKNIEYVSKDGAFKGDGGRAGIVLGHRGNLAAYLPKDGEIEAPAVEMADIPDRARRCAWQEEADKMQIAAMKQAKKALADALYYFDFDDAIQAMMLAPDREWIDDHEKLVKEFVEFMWSKGRGLAGAYSPYQAVTNAEKLLDRAGLAGKLTTGTRAGDVRRRAILALSYWSEYRGFSWKQEDTAAALESALAEFDATGPHADEEWSTLHHELKRALADVRAQMKPEEEEPANETPCAECGDLMEPQELERCSCGAALCEECYVERDHVFHDTERDPVYDDLVEMQGGEAAETAAEVEA